MEYVDIASTRTAIDSRLHAALSNGGRRFLACLGAMLFSAPCLADMPDAERLKALSSVLAYDQLLGRMVAYCEAGAPAQATATRDAWQQWRQTHHIEAVEASAGSKMVDNVRRLSAAKDAALQTELARQGPPDEVCAAMPAMWHEPSMDMTRMFPLAYASGANNAPSSAGRQKAARAAEVPLDRIRTAPGHGIAPADLVAVLLESRTQAVTGFSEHVYFLLRDGSAYLRGGLPPEDLDVARSRTLEPQQWARWRKNGSSYEIQRTGADGKPEGDWRRIAGTAAIPWTAGSTVAGIYSASHFYGSLMLGGTYSKSNLSLDSDGQFAQDRYSESGSGSMAAAGGFNAMASRSSGPNGSHAVAGGGNGGVAFQSRSSRDDGAEHRGTYKLDGYAVELHYDSGRVERRLSFNCGPKILYWVDRGYLREEGH